MAERWVMVSHQPLIVICPITENTGKFIRASGSTVETGDCTKAGEFTVTWGMSLLGETQMRDNKKGKAPPTSRLAEFVADKIGAIKYGRAMPRQYKKKA